MQLSAFDGAAEYLPDVCFANPPDLGILLGSGWGDSLAMDEVLTRIRYSDIPGLGAASVKGHSGEVLLYRRSGKLVAAWCGRRHYYEGPPAGSTPRLGPATSSSYATMSTWSARIRSSVRTSRRGERGSPTCLRCTRGTSRSFSTHVRTGLAAA